MKTSLPWFVFAGGGTGGHLFPALAVVESLRAKDSSIDVSFFCTGRPIDQEILNAAKIEAVPLAVQPFSTKPWHWPPFYVGWRRSIQFCRQAFEKRRPALVVGAGGYASGPPVEVAGRRGIPTFLLNPDAVPGLANRRMARTGRITTVFAQWNVTRDCFPPSVPVAVTGCPVRAAFRAVEPSGIPTIRESFGLEPGRLTLLVTGASQGARTINEAMMKLAEGITSTGWQVLHLSGMADRDRVADAYAEAKARAPTFCYQVLPFTERMAEAMAACDLIVSRAGASTLAEIQALGKPSVLFPYPFHRDQHQRHNARVLEQAGAAVLLKDLKEAGTNARQLEPVLSSCMRDEAKLAAMKQAACRLDRPDAADRMAEHLWQAVGRAKMNL